MTPFLRNDLGLLVAVPFGTVVRRRPLVWSFGSCHFRRRGDALTRLFVALRLLLAPFLLLLLLRLVVLGRVLHVALGFVLLAAARPALGPHVRWQGRSHWQGAPLGTCRTCRSRGYIAFSMSSGCVISRNLFMRSASSCARAQLTLAWLYTCHARHTVFQNWC